MTRQAFVQESAVVLDGDGNAPGAAITVALCGSWEHPPPCPLAPHHNELLPMADRVLVRTVFATEPDLEVEVRRRIVAGLSAGVLESAGAELSRWRLLSSEPAELRTDERALAGRLAQ